MHSFVRYIPNILSTFRLILAGLFPFCHEQEWIYLVLAGGASDFLDGWIARKWKVESWQGGLLDAIADKLFVLSVLITFVIAGKFEPWWIPVLLARDLTVTLIAIYALFCSSWSSFRQMDASLSGKLATAGQFLLFVCILVVPGLSRYLLWITILFSILAALDYGKKFVRALHNRNVRPKGQA